MFKYFVLLEVICLLNFISFLLKSVLFVKSTCFNLSSKFSAVNLLNFWIVIYLELSRFYLYSVLNFVFLTTSLSTASINFFKSTVAVFNLPTCKSFTYVFKLLKLVGTLFSLLMSSLPTSAFKAITSA